MKTLICISCFTILSLSAFCQISIGIKGGMNINYLEYFVERYDTAIKTKSTKGVHLGIFLEMPLSRKFSFAPEVLYSQRGYKYPVGQFGEHTKMNLNYIETSLIVAYSIGKFASIDLGPTLAYQTSAKIVYDGNNKLIAKWWNGNDFDLAITGGIRIHVLKKLSAVARYQFGVVAVDKLSYRDQNNVEFLSASAYNRNIQLGLAYKLFSID